MYRFALLVLVLLMLPRALLSQGEKEWTKPGTSTGQEIIGPDGGLYVWVPPGEFTMGSEEESGKPVRRVRLRRGFWLGKHEVTNEQYRVFCQATGREFPPKSKMGPRHPVVGVRWEAAQAYCEHHGLSLPTEVQWEYAARGPEGLTYPWGNDWDAEKCGNSENCGVGFPGTMPVGSFPAGDSWCGASDMAGNVREWCVVQVDEKHYGGPLAGNESEPKPGVLRGGSWFANALWCRSDIALAFEPDASVDDYGIRCAFSSQVE